MARFSANARRLDPYGNFKFRIRLDGRIVAGVSNVSALNWSAKDAQHRQDDDDYVGGTSSIYATNPAITLERGVTLDLEFEQWVGRLFAPGDGIMDVRRDLIVEVYDEAGQLALAYEIRGCWVSEYQSLTDLDANANAVAIAKIKLENAGWKQLPLAK